MTVQRAVSPRLSFFADFTRAESVSGALLLVCTVLALVWANASPPSYPAVWATPFTVGIGTVSLTKPLLLWVNDALMAVFFLVVGLEIKRELLVGELASVKRAALPMVAALGGMLVPAGLYAMLNAGSESMRGWAIPMATDIAFVLAIMSVLGDRVPSSLKVFLTALAIVDDIGAVLVIALFYSAPPDGTYLLGTAAVFSLLLLLGRLGVRRPLVYVAVGGLLWLLVLKSGLHATLAGILLAAAVPARAPLDPRRFVEQGRALIDEFDRASERGKDVLDDDDQHYALLRLRAAARHALTPLQRIEDAFHPWVSYLILPVFALANAGVALQVPRGELSVAGGIALGLLVGKPLGVVGFSLAAVRFGLASLPEDVTARHLLGAGVLAGIGFTMSIFLATLAFQADALALAKSTVLASSLVAAVVGMALLWSAPDVTPRR